MSSLASMMNSISTIFTMDVYKSMKPGQSESQYVRIGRITSLLAIVIAVLLAQPLLGGLESAFQTLQEYTGFIAPGVVAVFLMGMFWKPTTSNAAMTMLVVSVLANIALKFLTPEFAFVNRIWAVFLSCILAGFIVSKLGQVANDNDQVELSEIDFSTSTGFKIATVITVVILIALYAIFW